MYLNQLVKMTFERFFCISETTIRFSMNKKQILQIWTILEYEQGFHLWKHVRNKKKM